MSKQPVRGADVETLTPAVTSKLADSGPSEAEIADYLTNNADFFERHATLLTKLKLPHSRGNATVSLVERQVSALREKNQSLESRLRELIDVARSNDVLAAKIHRLACRLVRAGNATTLLDSMETSLREDFGASEWLLLLAPTRATGFTSIDSRHLRLIDPNATELKMFDTLFESARPRCGQIRDSQRDFLFGAGTIEIGSAALVPLGRELGFGLLAIGSPDAQRFHPTMSTDFLARIGDLVSEAVAAA
ncbi:DUF484 family protein [Peristeroidobacter soli]|jgi:uncharacterized protein YigA (DUF484 family)|uniref:DUF484 family protein n=1 Tax=Peristeroidobacter soli TaxID=2497877 RepID=UPI00101CAB3D|nr:DUF484 family protein [Peristeroidobacter soli]